MTDDSGLYFQARSFLERSSVSEVYYPYMVPKYECAVCKYGEVTFQFGYPQLDPKDVLNKAQLKILDTKNSEEIRGSTAILDCIQCLESHWKVPVTAGTRFGPARIRVSTKPRDDFDVMPLSNEFLMRETAARALRTRGFDFEYVPVTSTGKYAGEANFVQAVVPNAGNGQLVAGEKFCTQCKRRSGTPSDRRQTYMLRKDSVINSLPFFRPFEVSVLILSKKFVESTVELGLIGLELGKSLSPMPTI